MQTHPLGLFALKDSLRNMSAFRKSSSNSWEKWSQVRITSIGMAKFFDLEGAFTLFTRKKTKAPKYYCILLDCLKKLYIDLNEKQE